MHGLAAQVALILALVIAASATVLALARRGAGSFFLAGVLWTELIVGLAAIVGLGMAVTEQPPRDPLHIIYGALAIGVVPGAALVAAGRTGRRQTGVWAIAGIVLVILTVRLFQTGG